jgi:hypothetical protein
VDESRQYDNAGKIRNSKHQIHSTSLWAGLNNTEIQKPRGKNQNDNSKSKTFNLCSVILHFYFCILKGFV